MLDTSATVRLVVQAIPAVRPYLKGRALAFVFNIDPAYKSQEFYQATIEHLVRQVYGNYMGGEFIDIMANLIQGQLTDAFHQAWEDEGDGTAFPDYLAGPLEADILNQYNYVDDYYRDIVDARIDQTSIEPLLARADQWANQWDACYNEAVLLIRTETGGNLQWHKGNTEHGCDTCASLDGIVASAADWEALGVHPQGYPNDKLACQGGGPANYCDCTLDPTDQRRSPNAFETIMNIVETTREG